MSLSDTIETDIDKVESADKNVVIYLPDPSGDTFRLNYLLKCCFQEREVITERLSANVDLFGATLTFISQSVRLNINTVNVYVTLKCSRKYAFMIFKINVFRNA